MWKERSFSAGTGSLSVFAVSAPTDCSGTPGMSAARPSGSSVNAAVSLRSSWREGNRYAELYDVAVTAAGSAVNGWTVELPVPAGAALRDRWGGTFTLDNGILRIRSLDYNAALKAGETARDIGFILTRDE